MFEMGRKTCILPHLRLGDVAKFKFVVYRLPVYNPSSEPVTSLDPFIHDRGFHPSYDPEEYKGKRFRRYLTLGFCPAEKGKDDPALCGQRIVASISHIWDLDERQITVRFSCTVGQFGFHPNSLLPKVNYAAGEGILGNMEKLGKLVAELGTSIPEFTWGVGVWGKGVERARKSILTGMLARGTQLIEGYCKEKRLKDYLMEEKEIAKRDVVIMTMETMATFLRW
ncbi:hypothetical protein BC829DRAFT_380666 [Chytridium lagenaria]|nr:hypothetical protein BC829DRAFT_380666 [Chytridium lagenaria]